MYVLVMSFRQAQVDSLKPFTFFDFGIWVRLRYTCRYLPNLIGFFGFWAWVEQNVPQIQGSDKQARQSLYRGYITIVATLLMWSCKLLCSAECSHYRQYQFSSSYVPCTYIPAYLAINQSVLSMFPPDLAPNKCKDSISFQHYVSANIQYYILRYLLT